MPAMVTPETESFYVTDMDEYDNSLEIAVLDDGPSADYATYFYRYDGSALAFIGEVDGFPFKEQNGGINGFTGQNGINGTIRTDILETAYLNGYWWYDSNARKLEYIDGGMHQYQVFHTAQIICGSSVVESYGSEFGTGNGFVRAGCVLYQL